MFLLEILQIWAELNFQENPQHFQSSTIWNNSLIRVGGTPVLYPRWSKNSVNFVKDLLDDSSHYSSNAAYTQKYKFYPNFLEYYGLVAAVRDFKVKCNTAIVVS